MAKQNKALGFSQQENLLKPTYVFHGVFDDLEVYPDRVVIVPRGIWGFINKGFKGSKAIPFTAITAVQVKKSNALISGYIQFTLPGGNESKGGLFAAQNDENSVLFHDKGGKSNPQILKIEQYIREISNQARMPPPPPPRNDSADLSKELEKIAAMRANGILSEDEFRAAKKKLLGL